MLRLANKFINRALSKAHSKSEGPKSTPLSVDTVWFPKNGKAAILLRWFFSEWCNYRCPYCPQDHDRYAKKSDGYTAHAFDNHPVEKWLEAFDHHFADKRLSIVLTGGETMLDRPNMTKLINHLSRSPNVECIRIDTNAWWKPEQFKDLDTSKITLMCTFHPSQVKQEKFFLRIMEYIERGYNIGMVNYVMDEKNADKFEPNRKRLADLGIPLHPNPLWGSNGQYNSRDLSAMRRSIPEFDFNYRTGTLNPHGKLCRFPALSYEMDAIGAVFPGCHPELSGSFFDENLPVFEEKYSPCPHHGCACLDKYSFLADFERNISTNPLREYSKALSEMAASK